MVDWPDLGHPSPRSSVRRHEPIKWPAGSTLRLKQPQLSKGPTAVDLLRCRRTSRQFSGASPSELASWFELSCRVQQCQGSDLGFDLTRRPAPSAGAIHPIHVVLAWPDGSNWHRYDAFDHALVSFASQVDPQAVHAQMQEVLQAPKATLVLLAAEVGRTEAKYEHAASLVWRDAGALLATMALAAQALSLAFCPLGVTGEPWVGRLLEQQGLVGVGAAFVGRPGHAS